MHLWKINDTSILETLRFISYSWSLSIFTTTLHTFSPLSILVKVIVNLWQTLLVVSLWKHYHQWSVSPWRPVFIGQGRWISDGATMEICDWCGRTIHLNFTMIFQMSECWCGAWSCHVEGTIFSLLWPQSRDLCLFLSSLAWLWMWSTLHTTKFIMRNFLWFPSKI